MLALICRSLPVKRQPRELEPLRPVSLDRIQQREQEPARVIVPVLAACIVRAEADCNDVCGRNDEHELTVYALGEVRVMGQVRQRSRWTEQVSTGGILLP